MSNLSRIPLVVVAGVLACVSALPMMGCSQVPPAHLHVLATAPVGSGMTAPAGTLPGTMAGGPVIGVGPVSLPEYLDRSEVVWRRGGQHLVAEDGDRWAESLRAGIQRVLSVALARRLGGTATVLPAGDRDSEPELAIPVFIDAFERDEQGQVVLSVQWEVRRPRQAEVATQHQRRLYVLPVAQRAGGGVEGGSTAVEAQVQAMNAHLESLAADIAASLPPARPARPAARSR